jgi:hypothetical protein
MPGIRALYVIGPPGHKEVRLAMLAWECFFKGNLKTVVQVSHRARRPLLIQRSQRHGDLRIIPYLRSEPLARLGTACEPSGRTIIPPTSEDDFA